MKLYIVKLGNLRVVDYDTFYNSGEILSVTLSTNNVCGLSKDVADKITALIGGTVIEL